MNEQLPPEVVKKNRIRLVMVFAVAMLPLLVASFMYFSGSFIPSGRTNKGVLILPPIQFDELGVKNEQGEAVKASSLDNWTMIVIGANSCVEACAEALYLTRQTRAALGRETPRISRLYLSIGGQGDAGLSTEQVIENPKVVKGTISAERFYDGFKIIGDNQQLINEGYIFLADPLGNIMMYYTRENGYRDMLDDLKKLLKISNIG